VQQATSGKSDTNAGLVTEIPLADPVEFPQDVRTRPGKGQVRDLYEHLGTAPLPAQNALKEQAGSSGIAKILVCVSKADLGVTGTLIA
jgi:hypothetical protein